MKHPAINMLEARDLKRKKRQLYKNLHNSISKKRSRIYDLNPKTKQTSHRTRGNGIHEDQILQEILPYLSGHGLKKDNFKVAQIVSRSLNAFPRLQHLYMHGYTGGAEQPPKPLYTTVPKNRVSVPSRSD